MIIPSNNTTAKKLARISKRAIAGALLLLAVILILDLLNIPSRIGIKALSLNTSFWSALVGPVTTLLVFAASFHLIEKWNVEINQNKREAAKHLLLGAYKQCNETVEMLEYDFFIKSMVKHTNFNEAINESSPAVRLSKLPFQNEKTIMQFCTDGYIKGEEIDHYFDVKSRFSQYCTMKVTLFDAPDKTEILKEAVVKAIYAANHSLKKQ